MRRTAGRRGWRAFEPRDRRAIHHMLHRGSEPQCPCCGGALERRSRTRMAAMLPGDVEGYDLDCRCCRRFFARIRHTPASLYLLRIQRLAAAVLRA
jgi:hypothetical protein